MLKLEIDSSEMNQYFPSSNPTGTHSYAATVLWDRGQVAWLYYHTMP